MKKISIKPSSIAIAFYLLLLATWILVLVSAGKDYWYTGLAPWYGLGLVFLIAGTRYRVKGNNLVIRNPFERKEIPLDAIEEVVEIRNPIWKRMITGFPLYSLKVSHQEQYTLIHANDSETVQSLLSSVTPAA